MEFETLTIHAGQEPDPNNGAVMTPIYQTSTYAQNGVGRPRQGYEYSRTKNPTRLALERCLANLEGTEFGLAFASGMAATDTVLRLLGNGAHVVNSARRLLARFTKSSDARLRKASSRSSRRT